MHWTFDNFRAIWSPEVGAATLNTLIVAFGGTAIALMFGGTMAWLGARTDVPWKGLVHLAGVMPLFVSLLVAAVTWSLLGAGYSGYLNIIFRSLGLPFRIEMRSLAGIALVEGIYYAPYAYIFLFGAFTPGSSRSRGGCRRARRAPRADPAHDQLPAGAAGADRLGAPDLRVDLPRIFRCRRFSVARSASRPCRCASTT